MDFNNGHFHQQNHNEQSNSFFPDQIYLDDIGLQPMAYEDYAKAEIDLVMKQWHSEKTNTPFIPEQEQAKKEIDQAIKKARNEINKTVNDSGFNDKGFIPKYFERLP